jgi:hypothetical protein
MRLRRIFTSVFGSVVKPKSFGKITPYPQERIYPKHIRNISLSSHHVQGVNLPIILVCSSVGYIGWGGWWLIGFAYWALLFQSLAITHDHILFLYKSLVLWFGYCYLVSFLWRDKFIIMWNVVQKATSGRPKALSKPMIRKWWVIVSPQNLRQRILPGQKLIFNEHNFIKKKSIES